MLKKRANSWQNMDDYLRLACGFLTSFPFKQFRWNIQPAQVQVEILTLLKILAKRKPKNILEIGTAWGGTLFLFAKVAGPQAKIVSVDLPSDYARGYPEWRVNLYQSFGMPEQKICLIRKNSSFTFYSWQGWNSFRKMQIRLSFHRRRSHLWWC